MAEENADVDFEEQIELEKQEEEKNKSGKTRTDEDGTVYEWDEKMKAWFPKIDDNFIAMYQMNYGDTQNSDKTNYKEYWDWYNNQSNNPTGVSTDNSSHGNTGGEGGVEQSEDVDYNSDEYRKQYFDYYAYYYGHDAAVEYCGYDYYEGQAKGQSENKDANKKEEAEGKTEDKEGKTEDKEGEKQEGENDQNKGKKGQKRKKQVEQPKQEAKWFDVEESKNTTVYVSGLPVDITDEEFKELMNKCGMVMYDPLQKSMKLKLYKDEHGQPKGDGRCCYIKLESVDLALKILDGYEFRGHKIKVEVAKFSLKGDYDPSKRRKKLSNKEKRKLKEKQNKLFDWRPEKIEENRPKNEKVIVLKNMFDPKDFDDDPMVINELRDDVRQEAAKFGNVKNVKIFDNHPDGVMMVYFKEAEEADEFVAAQNHRWFSKRRIIAQTWDGRTKFEIEESAAERDIRLNKWQNYLEKSEDGKTNLTERKVSKDETDITKPDGDKSEDNTQETKVSKDETDITKFDSEKSEDSTTNTQETKVSKDETDITKSDSEKRGDKKSNIQETKMSENEMEVSNSDGVKTSDVSVEQIDISPDDNDKRVSRPADNTSVLMEGDRSISDQEKPDNIEPPSTVIE